MIGSYFSPYYGSSTYAVLMILLLCWAIPWKGVALWKTARTGHKIWFIVFLLVNTLGILEILYIFIFSKMAKVPVEEKNWFKKMWKKLLAVLGLNKKSTPNLPQ